MKPGKGVRRAARDKLQALVYGILPPTLEEGAGKRCSANVSEKQRRERKRCEAGEWGRGTYLSKCRENNTHTHTHTHTLTHTHTHTHKLHALGYDILPLEEGAGK